MPNGKISEKQKEILEYIKQEILNKGYPPAVREICEAVHLKSTSSVHSHLETLEKNGYIRRDPTKPRDGKCAGHRQCSRRSAAPCRTEHRKLFPDSCGIYAESGNLHVKGKRRKHDQCRYP